MYEEARLGIAVRHIGRATLLGAGALATTLAAEVVAARRHRFLPAEPVLEALPLAGGTHPDGVVELVEAAGWGPARLERLRDIEWARLLRQPPTTRLLGVTPQFVVLAG